MAITGSCCKIAYIMTAASLGFTIPSTGLCLMLHVFCRLNDIVLTFRSSWRQQRNRVRHASARSRTCTCELVKCHQTMSCYALPCTFLCVHHAVLVCTAGTYKSSKKEYFTLHRWLPVHTISCTLFIGPCPLHIAHTVVTHGTIFLAPSLLSTLCMQYLTAELFQLSICPYSVCQKLWSSWKAFTLYGISRYRATRWRKESRTKE